MPEVVCPEIVDERGNRSDRPCVGFCGPGDFDAWRFKARQRIAQALLRSDLPPQTRSMLEDWQAQVERLPKPMFGSADAVNMLVSMARQSECIALAPKIQELPPVIDPNEPWYMNRAKLLSYGLVAILLVWAYQSKFHLQAIKQIKKMIK